MASRSSRRNWVVVASQPAARGKDWIIMHLNRHDTGSTTARSVDEVALIRDTISHYAPVLIAPLSIQIRRAGVQKKGWGRSCRGRKKDWWPADTAPDPRSRAFRCGGAK